MTPENAMTDRRQFIRDAAATAGVLFTGCNLLDDQLHAQPAPAQKKRQVMVGGRRMKTIDVHAHVIVPEAPALMGRKTEPDNAAVMAAGPSRARFPPLRTLSTHPN